MSYKKIADAALFAILIFYLIITWTFSAFGYEKEIPDNESQQTYKLGSLTVTAQKKEENVQEVPESISVISLQDIEDTHLTDSSQIHTVVPNFMSYGHQ